MAYDPQLATKLAKEARRRLDAMRRKGESWCGMTRWFLWSAAARHGIVEMVDRTKAYWGDPRGVKVRKGCRRTLDMPWRRIFTD
jgi:hypothetical protein